MIIQVEELKKILDHPNLLLLDASDYSSISDQQRISTIPGAIHFDIKNRMSDQLADLPNMMLSPELFQEELRQLGISNDQKIVVFDNKGIYFSPRVWYMLRSVGHQDIAVLDGGLPAWVQAHHELSNLKPSKGGTGDFECKQSSFLFKNLDDIRSNLKSKEALVIDARSKGRYDGVAPEPRAGLSSGHIPYSINIPFSEVLSEQRLKSLEELKKIFNRKAIEDQELIFSCGSGITACIDLLAASLVLDNPLSVYDGSWTEWAQHPKTTIMTTTKSHHHEH